MTMRSPYRRFLKRAIDLGLSIALIVLLSPLMLVLAFFVRFALGTPVLFRQQRPGQAGRPFTLLKFRTMTDVIGPDGRTLPDNVRLTRFGRFLRASSLDELPEIFNVLIGDMSFVGPRPLLMEYLPLYSPEQARRHDTRPGITGWAQVHGRNALSWEQKFTYDLWYVQNLSFMLDMRILWRTVASVLFARGISQSGHATMERFRGPER